MKFVNELPKAEEAPVKLELVFGAFGGMCVKASRNGVSAELIHFSESGQVYRVYDGDNIRKLGFVIDSKNPSVINVL